jgi:hypothetical protein
MKYILIGLFVVACCICGCSNSTPASKTVIQTKRQSHPKAADVTHVSARQFTSILMVSPSHPQTKRFIGYEDGLAYLEVIEEKNGVTEREFYCTPKTDLPKHALDTLELMKKK